MLLYRKSVKFQGLFEDFFYILAQFPIRRTTVTWDRAYPANAIERVVLTPRRENT